jgi:enterobacterial common antigen flippase
MANNEHTYAQILKSTAMVGGSSVVNIAFGVVRTKAMALFLGPAGVGLMGLYSSVADLTQSLAGLGIQSSGVRQIAEAVGSGDADRIARTATVLRRISVILGLLGTGLLILFSRPVAAVTFGSHEQAGGVALLSVAVLFRLVSAGQGALIQGMRRISDLARMSALAAICGTVISIPLVYLFREQGVVPSLIAVAAVSILTSWWYSRKIRIEAPVMTLAQVGAESAALIKLGMAFMASGFLTMGAAYAIRLIVLRRAGFEAAGLYQAAWALGGLYVAFILQAMGADFYPRLTAVARDNVECNRLVNEQAQISAMLAGPGVIATLAFAPLVLSVFYSAQFYAAVGLLRWICLGMMLRVVAWPMGFILVAKGAQHLFFWTEVAATVVHVGLAWLLVRELGVTGAGIAFFGLYLWHGCFVYAIVRQLSGFRWSATNRTVGMVFLPLMALAFSSCYLFPTWVATCIGGLTAVFGGIYSIRTLLRLLSPQSIPEAVWWWLSRFRLADKRSSRLAPAGGTASLP